MESSSKVSAAPKKPAAPTVSVTPSTNVPRTPTKPVTKSTNNLSVKTGTATSNSTSTSTSTHSSSRSTSPIPVTGSLASLPSGFESLYDMDDTEEMSLDYTTCDYTEEWTKEQHKVSQYGYDEDGDGSAPPPRHERDLIPGVPSFILTRPLDITSISCHDPYTHGTWEITHPAWNHVTSTLILQQITREHVMRQQQEGSRPMSGNNITTTTTTTTTPPISPPALSSLGYPASTLVLRKIIPDPSRSITEMHWGGHILQIIVYYNTNSTPSTISHLPSMSYTHGHIHDISTIDYLFNGDRYRQVFKDTEMGYVEDNHRIHGTTWQRCAWWLQQLLIPLGLGSQGRRGWICFFDQCISWEKCGVYVQQLKTIYDVHRLN